MAPASRASAPAAGHARRLRRASVRLAIWSITTRVRAASSAASAKSSRKAGSSAVAPPRPDRLEQLGEQRALPLHQLEPVLGAHHVVGGDPLEHGDLLRGLVGHDQVGPWRTSGPSPYCAPGGRVHAAAEDPDQVAGEVLQRGEAAPAAVVRRDPGHDPTARTRAERLLEHVVVGRVGEVPVAHGRPRRARSSGRSSTARSIRPADDAVLEVVHRVGHVVGEVHHLRLDAASAARRRPSRSQSKTARSSS